MLDQELTQLEDRISRMLAALQQVRLERRSVVRERDRLLATNNELRRRIEGVVERVKSLESEQQA